jgi:hypothetical protein
MERIAMSQEERDWLDWFVGPAKAYPSEADSDGFNSIENRITPR